ncbi:DsbA family protein [Oceanobacillus salinisoli]|uniref:DsbA family protein n=1 Tax=Oceanobacillus salinisoli TaxID=2678611 RepID=UPI001E301268|nr:DsbA family protein [Oceanobacillus salinisoli]
MAKNMICDLETGVCGVPGEEEMKEIDLNQSTKTIDLYYVTDPICSHFWALEPVLGRFREEYGNHFNFHTVMGGLLEKWEGPVDPGNGIFKPADVASHWREVGEHYRMPIDGTLWHDNPVQSSFPPSRVYKVIQHNHNDELANEYLRRAREALFVFNKNIGEKSMMIEIVNNLGLDGEEIIRLAEGPLGGQLLEEDFTLARDLGVRGFPTIIMVNKENKGVSVVGGRPLVNYISALTQTLNGEELISKDIPSLKDFLTKEKLLFSKELEVMYNLNESEISDFVKKELPIGTYEEKEILGEKYYLKVKE